MQQQYKDKEALLQLQLHEREKELMSVKCELEKQKEAIIQQLQQLVFQKSVIIADMKTRTSVLTDSITNNQFINASDTEFENQFHLSPTSSHKISCDISFNDVIDDEGKLRALLQSNEAHILKINDSLIQMALQYQSESKALRNEITVLQDQRLKEKESLKLKMSCLKRDFALLKANGNVSLLLTEFVYKDNESNMKAGIHSSDEDIHISIDEISDRSYSKAAN